MVIESRVALKFFHTSVKKSRNSKRRNEVFLRKRVGVPCCFVKGSLPLCSVDRPVTVA